MSRVESKLKHLIFLCLAVILSVSIYLVINTRGNFEFAFMLRSKRIVAFFLVGMTTTISTIVFQTMTQNNILTPNIIGLDSLYVLLQTAIIFFLGLHHSFSTNIYLNFFLSILLMIGSSVIFYWLFFKKFPGRINLLLMLGLIAGTLFGSLTTFLQVMIDPNEFESVFSRTVASFTNVNSSLLLVSAFTCIPIICYLFSQASKLDVLHLGRSYSIGLGIDIDRYYLILFILISILIAISTALVGPVSFIGFIGANLAYRSLKNYRHDILFIGGSLISQIFIIVGQTLVEHVFKLQTTLGVIVQFVGGVYFLFILLKERNNPA